MRKTKIICTLGPSTDREGVMREMILAGMNIARFNFSHGSYEEHKGRLDKLKQLRAELNMPVAALLDTKGPEIRLRQFKDGKTRLEAGQTFTLTTREVEGTNEICSVSYKDLPGDVSVGSTILLADGLISLTVTALTETDIQCVVNNSGPISNNKGVNVPGVSLSMPYLSQKDKDDILFGIQNGYDFIAASFTRNAQDIQDIRRLLNEHNSPIRIIAKIENQEGIDNIDEILAAADGVMVARGDMGVEIDFTEIPMIQKDIIYHSFSSGKPVVTATQMLESMIENPRPTRAEITDVANAIYDGTSAIMLSGETAAGKYPVEAVRTMAAIAARTESDSSYIEHMRKPPVDTRMTIAGATAHAACGTAANIKASAIVTVTQMGETARLLSKVRPQTPIIACVMDEQVQRHLAISWGVHPLLMPAAANTDELVDLSIKTAVDRGLLHEGELVVVTAGVPVGVSGTTNMMKVHMVGDLLASGVGIGEHNAKGPLCVCRNSDEVASKFKKGDVLFVPYTDNSMMPYMREASAIVVEQAGMNSHAAISGLALGKAVMVGVSNATSLLKDGVMVSVDCSHGTIQNMPC